MRKMDKLILSNVQINSLSSNKTVFKTCLRQVHTWRTDTVQSLEWHTAAYVQHWNWAQPHQRPLTRLILRGRSRSWARPWSRHGALIPRLGPAIVLLGRWWTWGRFGSTFFLPVLCWGRWSTAGLLVTARLLGSAAGIALRLSAWTALWARLAFSRTGAGLLGARARFLGARARLLGARARLWLVGSGAGPARLWFPFSRVSSRPWTGMVASFVAARTRSVGKTIFKLLLSLCLRLPCSPKSKHSHCQVNRCRTVQITDREWDLERLLELLLLRLPRLLLRERRPLRDLWTCPELERYESFF